MNFRGTLRAVLRAVCFGGFVLVAWSHYWLRIRRLAEREKWRAQAAWLHRWSRRICWLLDIALEVRGAPPRCGLIASNHLSYLDVFVLCAIDPCVFVAKIEISKWPVFGRCAKCGGTIFVDRARRAAVAPVATQMREVLSAGLPLVLFPEGTTSDGRGVLPFKSALFGPAVELEVQITAAAIDYELPGGSAASEVCFVGNAALLPHLWNLLTKTRLVARVSFGEPRAVTTDRKTLASELHAAVTALRED